MKNKSTLEIMKELLPVHYDLTEGSNIETFCRAIANTIDIKIRQEIESSKQRENIF
jgi:hypothetical protein